MDTKERVLAEIARYKVIGTARMEDETTEFIAYLLPDGNIQFISKDCDQFVTLDPSRIFDPSHEVWVRIFKERGWYAIRSEEGRYDLRFNVH